MPNPLGRSPGFQAAYFLAFSSALDNGELRFRSWLQWRDRAGFTPASRFSRDFAATQKAMSSNSLGECSSAENRFDYKEEDWSRQGRKGQYLYKPDPSGQLKR